MNTQNRTIILSHLTLKNDIRNKKLEVDNLTLTKDNRLVSKKIDNEKVYITRSIITNLKSDKALSFKSNVNLDKVISKANILGTKIDKIQNNLYTIINEASIVFLSDKQISLPENSDWIFMDTEFSKIDISNVDTSSTVSMIGTFSECKTKELEP